MREPDDTLEPPGAPDERPQRRREWSGGLRSVGLPLLIAAAVVLSVWMLQRNGIADGGFLPDFHTGSPPTAGNAAPDFTLTTLEGDELALSDLRGRPVLVNFWASWCGPCRQEAPHLVDAYDRFAADGLVILGVNMEEDRGTAEQFARDYGFEFPVLLDTDGNVLRQYHITGPPSSFFIDRDGVVRSVVLGPLQPGSLDERLAEIAGPAEAHSK